MNTKRTVSTARAGAAADRCLDSVHKAGDTRRRPLPYVRDDAPATPRHRPSPRPRTVSV